MSEAERLAQALERDGKGFSATLGFTPACMPQAAAELRRLAAISESNAIDALNYESRIARLQAEVEALRADAERYRWLRDNDTGDWAICVWALIRDKMINKEYDAAIDAARAK